MAQGLEIPDMKNLSPLRIISRNREKTKNNKQKNPSNLETEPCNINVSVLVHLCSYNRIPQMRQFIKKQKCLTVLEAGVSMSKLLAVLVSKKCCLLLLKWCFIAASSGEKEQYVFT